MMSRGNGYKEMSSSRPRGASFKPGRVTQLKKNLSYKPTQIICLYIKYLFDRVIVDG